MAEETVGTVWLELKLKDGDISGQVKNAIDEAKKLRRSQARRSGKRSGKRSRALCGEVDAGKPFELAQDTLGLLNQRLIIQIQKSAYCRKSIKN